MRRFAYVALAMLALAIGAVVVIPEQVRKTDARSLLIGIAKAMEEAKTLHVVGRASVLSPRGIHVSTLQHETWHSGRAFYMVHLNPDGTRFFAGPRSGYNVGFDADTLQAWSYNIENGKRVLYLADLRPLGDRVAETMGKFFVQQQFRLTREAWEALPNATKSVSRRTRDDGRKVVTLTVLYSPIEDVTQRIVLEVEAKSGRLLSQRVYMRYKKEPEELVGVIDKIEYDVPIPVELTMHKVPAGAKTKQAWVIIEDRGDYLSLVMKAHGRDIFRTGDVSTGKEEPRPEMLIGGGMASGPLGPSKK